MKSRPPLRKGLGKNLHRYTRKGSGNLWSASYSFAGSEFVGFQARQDQIPSMRSIASRVEKWWHLLALFWEDLKAGGREGSIHFSSLSASISASFRPNLNLKSFFQPRPRLKRITCAQNAPVYGGGSALPCLAAPLVGHPLRAFPFGNIARPCHVSLFCHFFLFFLFLGVFFLSFPLLTMHDA